MGRLNRRDFLKAIGVGGSASALSACGMDDNRYPTPIESILPYVVRPDQVVPGTPTFFATTVTKGPGAHSVLVRHRDGRAINVGANTHTKGKSSVPKAALLELQKHYSPDRLQGPKNGANGSFTDTTWDEGLKKLSAAVKQAKEAGKTVAYLGGYRSGAIVNLINDFTDGNAVFWEAVGREAEANASQVLFGKRFLPAYRLNNAEYILSFGAEFLGSWGPANIERQYADAKNPNKGNFVTRFAYIGSHLDQTSANADDWHSAVPGSEVDVAMAIAALTAKKSGYQGPLSATLNKVDIAKATARSGMAKEVLEQIAAHLAKQTAVVLPGGAGTPSATELARATYLINMVCGAAGKTFGTGRVYSGPIHSTGRVQKLIAKMAAGQVGVLLLDEANPMYSLPADAGVAEGLAKVDLIVGLSSHGDETTASAHLILPTSNSFEDWGDERPHRGLFLLRQPTMSPLYDTRSLGDILLSSGRAAGLVTPVAADADAPANEAMEHRGDKEQPPNSSNGKPTAVANLGFEPGTWKDYLMAHWEAQVYPHFMPAGGLPFGRWWEQSLADGFVTKRAGIRVPTLAVGPVKAPTSSELEGGDFYLVPALHSHCQDGRYANQPWAREVPDPMTGQVWGSWAEISPSAAKKLGVSDNDLIEIKSAAGAVKVGVEIARGMRDDTVVVALGGGRTAGGRYANGVGVNVVDLLSAKAQKFNLGQTKVSIKNLGAKADLVSTFGHDDDKGKNMAVQVAANALAAHGDRKVDHPGSITGIHHLPRDPRLKTPEQQEFYPNPEHPNYRFAMTVDTNACTGCGTCSISCYAENNLPVTGKENVAKGREFNWIRIDRFFSEHDGNLSTQFVPMMCQQCSRAPCESVCPVLATYHTIDGLNAMIYNRCVGTRYCANNCPFLARRFNWHTYDWPEPFNLQLNPDVTVRTMGIMEKCTFCVQRIRDVKSAYRDQGFTKLVPNDALQYLPACAEVCPTGAIEFGNLNDPASTPARTRQSARTYEMFEELNCDSAVNYLAKGSHHVKPAHHVSGDADGHGTESTDHGKKAKHGDKVPSGVHGRDTKSGKSSKGHKPGHQH